MLEASGGILGEINGNKSFIVIILLKLNIYHIFDQPM